MNYLIYKITNTANNKIYIGCHKTENIEDGYMGSGKILKRAIAKYGIDKFTKEILHNFDKSEDMFTMESELVNEDFVKDQNTYNLKEGGNGGAVNMKETEYYKSGRHSAHNKEISILGGQYCKKHKLGIHSLTREEIINNSRKAHESIREKYPNWTFGGKKHSNTSIEKMKESHKDIHKGSKNSQYGTMWITNEEKQVNLKINKTDIIPDGFRKGYIINFSKYFDRINAEMLHKEIVRRKKDKIYNKQKLMATLLYKRYIDLNYHSICKFVNDKQYNKSYQSLVKSWKKFIPGFQTTSGKGYIPIKK